MSHVTHTNGSYACKNTPLWLSHWSHFWMSHVTHIHADGSCVRKIFLTDLFIGVTWLLHICDITHSCVWHDSCIGVTYEWVIIGGLTRSHIWMRHFSHMINSRPTDEWVMSHLLLSPVPLVGEEWAMSHSWLSYSLHMKSYAPFLCLYLVHECAYTCIHTHTNMYMHIQASICIYTQYVHVNSYIYRERGRERDRLEDESCHTYENVMTCMHVHVSDMTRAYEWHDAFISLSLVVHMSDMTLTSLCDMTHSFVWNDSFIGVTWLVHRCDMAHSYAFQDSVTCVTWLTYTCSMIYSYV